MQKEHNSFLVQLMNDIIFSMFQKENCNFYYLEQETCASCSTNLFNYF